MLVQTFGRSGLDDRFNLFFLQGHGSSGNSNALLMRSKDFFALGKPLIFGFNVIDLIFT
jgi:hypothetical protein